MRKVKIMQFAKILIYVVLFWIVLTSLIYRFRHPEKSETELFLDIPKYFICNFK